MRKCIDSRLALDAKRASEHTYVRISALFGLDEVDKSGTKAKSGEIRLIGTLAQRLQKNYR
jgi:hypothetical protein